MSREFKISSIRQADDAINTVNERLYEAREQFAKKLDEVRNEAERMAKQKAAQEAERTKREMMSKLNNAIDDMNENLRKVDKRQQERLEKMAGELYDVIYDVAESFDDALAKSNAELKNDIKSLEQRTKKRFETIDKHIKQLEQNVDSRFKSQQTQLDKHTEQIKSLQQTVDAILDRFSDEAQKRKEAVALAKTTYDNASRRVDIARFCPEKTREIQKRMEALLADPSGYGALGQAKEAILQMQLAEEEALKRKIIYDAIRSNAMAVLETVLAEVHCNREVSVAYSNDPESATLLETDFWNRGKYDVLSRMLETLRHELESEPDAERIREIVAQIGEIEADSALMVEKAVKSAILSENRVELTENIVTVLISQGWQIEHNSDGSDAVGYLGGEDRDNDWREGVFAVLRSVNGERISIVIRPDENEMDNQIIFHRNDERNITDLDYIRSLQRIKAQIEKSGHKLGSIDAPVGGGNEKIPELSDGAKMGKKGAAKKINERVLKR